MKSRSSGLLLSVALFLFSVPLIAQVNDTYVIPAVANASGVGTTRWATEFYVFNPQAYTLTVTAIFLPSGGGTASQVDFDVPSNATAFAENVLRDVFSASGTGSLLVATFASENPGVPNNVLARSFLVNSNTYNNASSGTYGQGVPGVWAGLQDFASDGITAVAHGIRNRGTLSGFRTNIGAVNLGRFSVVMKVSVYDDAGRTLARDLPFDIPPQGHVQHRLPIEVDHGSVEFLVDDSRRDAVVFAYASRVDNRSGDGVYITPVLLASPRVVFPKMISPTEIGTKITTEVAQRIAATAQHLGKVATLDGGRLSR